MRPVPLRGDQRARRGHEVKPAFCASCIEERDDLTQTTGSRGQPVWLCEDCADPVGQLKQFDVESDARGEGIQGMQADGNRQRPASKGRRR